MLHIKCVSQEVLTQMCLCGWRLLSAGSTAVCVCVKEREVGRLVEVSEKGRKGEERTTWRLGGR